MQIKQALQLSEQLNAVSDSPQLDLEYLLCHVLGKQRSYLYTWPEKVLSEQQQDQLHGFITRRLKGEPVAHIIGRRGFWRLDLEVSPDTLIPRPDTEVLVEKALELCQQKQARVADLGTGSGAIALALAVEHPAWEIVASDNVPEAAALAERNRKRLQFGNVQVLQGSWFQPHDGIYDLIVSNPPYIDPDDPHLEQGDVRFEPLSALTAGNKGMADIELLADQARAYLKKDGYLIFEHGYDQGVPCRDLLQRLGYVDIGTQQDYGQNDRVTYGRWPG
ncbi:MAG: protein-(glutamine-N5) methyltransferase, release factor-specific [Neptuniibacter caesariensis]|uniref:Release factor glutamine methyltransferase n=1 Tax=Neptuniibacter caesariensis TaxID=207954 RepID=A0A2G6JJ02_NEPCE|nr:MAG: protein-(glutamine-N5) methyltransferase, release factor-specific [Neptuniibacter caesariensis]